MIFYYITSSTCLNLFQKSCLKNFTKNSKPDVVRLLTDTIEEITKGIARPQLRKDADLKRLKLVAVLLCKVLSTENVNDESSEGDSENLGGSWLEGWEHVTYGFPHLGWQFVFDVVKASCLWQELFKVGFGSVLKYVYGCGSDTFAINQFPLVINLKTFTMEIVH